MMNELEQYLETIESYAMVGDWDTEAYDHMARLGSTFVRLAYVR